MTWSTRPAAAASTPWSSIGFSLANTKQVLGAVENLTLTGAAAINGTGNSLANTITGNTAANTLYGAAGNDKLNGGAGADAMFGGTGNDTYFVDNVKDVVNETGGNGIDTVQSSIGFSLANTKQVLGAVENFTLTGAGAINGTGNSLANTITGNAAANTLGGSAGNDRLFGVGRQRQAVRRRRQATSSCSTRRSMRPPTAIRSPTSTMSTTRYGWRTRCSRNSASPGL